MDRLKVSVVSYLNAEPFVYGLHNSEVSGLVKLIPDTPSTCARKLAEGSVDIGLIPTASIPGNPDIDIISDYCIGSSGEVRTVVLASNVPVKNINKIILDKESKTSALLAQVLAKNYWHIAPDWKDGGYNFEKESIIGNVAGLVIGDKVFEIESRYPYIYDLGEEWKKLSGYGFAFACWATNRKLSGMFKDMFNNALKLGIDNICRVADKNMGKYPGLNVYNYYTKNISFVFDRDKRKGLELFWKYIESI